jgi:hypothetical protein
MIIRDEFIAPRGLIANKTAHDTISKKCMLLFFFFRDYQAVSSVLLPHRYCHAIRRKLLSQPEILWVKDSKRIGRCIMQKGKAPL